MGWFSGKAKKNEGGGDSILGVIRSSRSSPPSRNVSGIIQAYNDSPWLRAVVSKVAHAVASTRWKLLATRTVTDGKFIRQKSLQTGNRVDRHKTIKRLNKAAVTEVVEVDDHPLLDVLNSGNDFMTGLIVRRITEIYLDLTGSSFLIKQRNALGQTARLWPVPPSWVTTTPTPSYPYFTIKLGLSEITFPQEDILWIVDPDPAAPYTQGSGMGVSLGDELDIDEYAAKFTKDFFFNNARPDLIISAEGLQRDETTRLEQDWNRKNQGFFRRFRAHFVNRKIDVTPLKQDMSSLQTIDLRKMQRDLVLQIYGVPPEIMGIIESSNRATIEGADYIFARWVIEPRLEILRSYYQQFLVPEFDERLVIDYESPIAEDMTQRLEVVKAAPWNFKTDEIRELAEFDPLPDGGGDVFMTPLNLVPVHDLMPDDQGDEPAVQGGPKTRGLHPPRPSGIIAKGFLSPTSIEALVGAVDAKVFTDQLVREINDIVTGFGKDQLERLGSDVVFDDTNARVNEFIHDRSFDRLSSINITTQNALKAQLRESMMAGENLVETTTRVNHVFTQASGHRARTIARTESVRAANFGANEAMVQAGVEGKRWLSSRDTVVRDTHAPGTGLDGQTVPVKEDFVSPRGPEGPYPGELGDPSEDVNCRCTVVAIAILPKTEVVPARLEGPFREFNDPEEIESWATTTYGDAYKTTPIETQRALDDYLSSAYADINAKLRGAGQTYGFVSPDRIETDVKLIDQFLAVQSLPQDLVLWRGVRSIKKLFGGPLDKILIGTTFRDDGYISTSLNAQVAKKFQAGSGAVLKIRAPAGTRGAYATKFVEAENADEYEVLLARGYQLHVVDVDRTSRTVTVDLIPGTSVEVTPLPVAAPVKQAAPPRLPVEARRPDPNRFIYTDTNPIVILTTPTKDVGRVMNEAQKTAYWKSFEFERQPYERRLVAASRRAFAIQRQAVMAKLKKISEE